MLDVIELLPSEAMFSGAGADLECGIRTDALHVDGLLHNLTDLVAEVIAKILIDGDDAISFDDLPTMNIAIDRFFPTLTALKEGGSSGLAA